MDSVYLKITKATVLDGAIVTPGDIVEVTNAEAKLFLSLGKAELATDVNSTEEEQPTEAPAESPSLEPEPEPIAEASAEQAESIDNAEEQPTEAPAPVKAAKKSNTTKAE